MYTTYLHSKTNESSQCAECGGFCCKHVPGANYPEDFGLFNEFSLPRRLIESLRSGLYSIDRWAVFRRPGMSSGYWVRPKTWTKKGNQIIAGPLYHESEPNGCIFLTTSGCRLTWPERPFQCREYEPALNFPKNCGPPDKKSDPKYVAAQMWEPFEKLLVLCAEIIDLDQLFLD